MVFTLIIPLTSLNFNTKNRIVNKNILANSHPHRKLCCSIDLTHWNNQHFCNSLVEKNTIRILPEMMILVYYFPPAFQRVSVICNAYIHSMSMNVEIISVWVKNHWSSLLEMPNRFVKLSSKSFENVDTIQLFNKNCMSSILYYRYVDIYFHSMNLKKLANRKKYI